MTSISAGIFQSSSPGRWFGICMGQHAQGQTNVPRISPTRWRLPPGIFHCLAVKSDGSVVGMGWQRLMDKPMCRPEATNVVAVAAGEMHSMALRGDGSVVAWGRTNYQTVPPEATNVVAISSQADR